MKQIALLMSICYLIAPLQQQITLVLHEIFHSLEMPTSVLSHHSDEEYFMEAHTPHQHENKNVQHEHPFIDLVNTVLDASNENHEPEKFPLVKIELKKHITSTTLQVPVKFEEERKSRFYSFRFSLPKGHPNAEDAPPKDHLI